MQVNSMSVDPAILPHTRTPGVILLARDLKRAISLLTSIARKWSRRKPNRPGLIPPLSNIKTQATEWHHPHEIRIGGEQP